MLERLHFTEPARVPRPHTPARFVITIIVLTACSFLWWQGLRDSPIIDPTFIDRQPAASARAQENSPEYQAERVLAEAYWRRYPDIKTNPYYGSSGPMGIFGPRKHFEQHGKQEDRIFAPIIVPEDLTLEQQFAESYWNRYRKIAESRVWGRNSALGILGPRDHFLHHGKQAGFKWSVDLQAK